MTISFDTTNYVIESTASITDLPAFHATLRDWEDSEEGVIHPVTHTWKALDLGGGAYFYQADLLSPWQLKMVGAGPFSIAGNLNGSIVPTGVQVERKTSAAFSTTAIGGSGPTAAEIAAAVLASTVESPYTLSQLIKLQSAILLGKVSGAGSGTEVFRDVNDTTDRVTATVDETGNRTAITLVP